MEKDDTSVWSHVNGSGHTSQHHGTALYDEDRKVVKSAPVWKAEPMADLSAVLQHLKTERAKLDKAIAALSGLAGKSTGGARGTRRALCCGS